MLPAVFDFLNGPVRDLVTQIYEAVGYLGVALWVAIESVVIPIPSELVLPFAGFLVGEGTALEPISGAPWNYWLTVLAGTLGATVGALIAYAIGAWGGRPDHRAVGARTSGSRPRTWIAPMRSLPATVRRPASSGGCCRSSARSCRSPPASRTCRWGDSRSSRSWGRCRGPRRSCSPGSSSGRTGRRSAAS